ncbi:uncharacterized protein [Elaeis guineensis]|uniref:Uncharacterized protein LOC105048164 n=1 Tax=Elaeis guineensis var. tenera TaxID=51953 RepID=A0A6I9RFA8_ELAGV|nr:uncharacterized protein LOC105048164 [Elaeis guineensis]
MATISSGSWDCNLEDKDLERLAVAPEVDGALLMELLEESYVDEAEDDRLKCVMRSLEAEINHVDPMVFDDGESTTGPRGDIEDGGILEDILSDFDSYGGSRSPAYFVEDPFDLVDMEVGNGMETWCMEAGVCEGDMVGYGEPKEYGGFYYGEGTMDQVYTPLWQ